jgi:hypothetical protein
MIPSGVVVKVQSGLGGLTEYMGDALILYLRGQGMPASITPVDAISL